MLENWHAITCTLHALFHHKWYTHSVWFSLEEILPRWPPGEHFINVSHDGGAERSEMPSPWILRAILRQHRALNPASSSETPPSAAWWTGKHRGQREEGKYGDRVRERERGLWERRRNKMLEEVNNLQWHDEGWHQCLFTFEPCQEHVLHLTVKHFPKNKKIKRIFKTFLAMKHGWDGSIWRRGYESCSGLLNLILGQRHRPFSSFIFLLLSLLFF